MTNTNTVQTQIKFLDDGIKPGGTRQAKVALLLRRILEHNRNAPERETTIIVCLILRRRRRRGEALKIMSIMYLEIFGGGGAGVSKLPGVDLNAAGLAPVASGGHRCQDGQDGQDGQDDQDGKDGEDDDDDQEVWEVSRFQYLMWIGNQLRERCPASVKRISKRNYRLSLFFTKTNPTRIKNTHKKTTAISSEREGNQESVSKVAKVQKKVTGNSQESGEKEKHKL